MEQNNASTLFGKHQDFLSHTLAHHQLAATPCQVTLPSGCMRLTARGILEFQPNQATEPHGTLLSAGVHGNETAPVELLNQLVSEILAGELEPRSPAMIILGHPEAMKQEQRFLDFNMNRLFCGAYRLPEYLHSPDAKRAETIEKAVLEFHQRSPLACHLDLHTAIRDSRIERFALYPFVPGRQIPQQWIDWLESAGITSVLLQNSPATTFSSFSASQCGSESFTLELGKVRPFGQNDLKRYENVSEQLKQLLCSAGGTSVSPAKGMQLFEVAHEIIHTGEGFVLNIPEDVKNFTEYPPGSEIWRDHTQAYVVQGESQYIVFPNSKVPAGQRAGLMLREVGPR
ncbi:MAG: succinylglutamate desuccinylase [Oleiphilus sp.]|nr:MAG: succinylglutamate desuccinylase [Oleiphilus sp.]